MNYQFHYDSLINRARTRQLEGYCEEHHIVPRCLGGSDDKSNLVKLTPEEHYVAHQLLVKLYPNNHKLMYAAAAMIMGSSDNQRSNKMYGWLRRKYSVTVSAQKRKLWDSYTPEQRTEKSFGGNRFSRDYMVQRNKEKCSKTAVLTSKKTGISVEVVNVAEFCRENKINYGNMKTMLRGNGNMRSCAGYTGKYL